MATRSSRRAFMKGVAIGVGLPLIVCRQGDAKSARRPPRVGAIGVGGRGQFVVPAVAGRGRAAMVALCDTDEKNLAEASHKFPDARTYVDWRALLADEGERIDAVCIATPDHTHAPVAMAALRAGKHVFCEKPLTHEVYEARQLAEVARESGLATQMGIQMHGNTSYRKAVRLLQKGTIGKVAEWHSWCRAHYGKPGMARPAGEDPVPAHLHWDLWLGVAPERPYKEGVYHPGSWRTWRDFGGGALGDFGCHILDPVFTALGIGAPLTIRAEADEADDEVWPHRAILHYEFPGTDRTAGKTIRATWYDAGQKPKAEHIPSSVDDPLPDDGSLIIGEKGVMVLPHCAEPRLYPKKQFEKRRMPDLDNVNLYAQWVDACQDHGATEAGFDYAGPLTEAVLLGTVALRFGGSKLQWDAAKFEITNLAQANAFLRRPYRKGWAVEGLSA